MSHKVKKKIGDIKLHLFPLYSKIFWTDESTYDPKVELANKDGSGRTRVATGVIQPYGLALDPLGM